MLKGGGGGCLKTLFESSETWALFPSHPSLTDSASTFLANLDSALGASNLNPSLSKVPVTVQ